MIKRLTSLFSGQQLPENNLPLNISSKALPLQQLQYTHKNRQRQIRLSSYQNGKLLLPLRNHTNNSFVRIH
ncbi:MAG: hypothetical protein Q8S18_00480 [Bacteroidales bacterium]|nr:hypothetical protein [Bacteroidales bacterium]